MKIKITIAVLLVTVIGVIARVSSPFLGWDRLETDSPSIIVADPGNPTPPPGPDNGPRYDFSITVLSTLKGTNDMHHARLQSDHELRPRQAYLVFADYNNGIFTAYEEYKVIPLGITYRQEMIAGKPLDEQLQILFKLAVTNLDNEIAQKEAEKERIESGIEQH